MLIRELVEALTSERHADLYHVTSLRGLKGILESDELRRSSRGNYVSLTRNAAFWGWNSADHLVRLTLDGEALRYLLVRQGLRMRPIEEPRLGMLRRSTRRGNIDEREERVHGEKITGITSVIKVIDARPDPREHAWQEDHLDLSNLVILSRLQRRFRVPINYSGEALAAAARRFGYFLEPEYDKYHFLNGPFTQKYDHRGEQVGMTLRQAMQEVYRNLNLPEGMLPRSPK